MISITMVIRMIIGVLTSSMVIAFPSVLMLLGVLEPEMIVVGGSLEIPTTGKARSNSEILPVMSYLSAR